MKIGENPHTHAPLKPVDGFLALQGCLPVWISDRYEFAVS